MANLFTTQSGKNRKPLNTKGLLKGLKSTVGNIGSKVKDVATSKVGKAATAPIRAVTAPTTAVTKGIMQGARNMKETGSPIGSKSYRTGLKDVVNQPTTPDIANGSLYFKPGSAAAPTFGPAVPENILTKPGASQGTRTTMPSTPSTASQATTYDLSGLSGQDRQAELERQAGFGRPRGVDQGPDIQSLRGERITEGPRGENVRFGQGRPDLTGREVAGQQTPQTLSQAGGLQTENELAMMQSQYLDLLRPSAEEQALQSELADLRESANLGISGLEGQGRGIPLGLVRGKQSQLQEQAAIKEQALIDRLANATAQRQAAAQALQAQLGFEAQQQQQEQQQRQFEAQMGLQEQKLQQSQMQPFEFNGNLVQFDPASGQLRTVAEGAVVQPGTDDMQEYQFALQTGFQGSFVDYLQQKSGSGTGSMKSFTPGDMIYDPATGQFTQVPGSDFQTPEEQAATTAKVRESLGRVNTIDEIMNSPGLKSGVGLGFLSRGGPFNRRERANLFGAVNELISEETLNTLTDLKAKGGTLGALSEKELAILQTAATRMGQWIERDASGKITKIKVGEDQFIDELNRIKGELLYAVDDTLNNGVYTTMFNQGQITQDEYVDLVRGLQSNISFNQDLNTSQKGSVLELGAITGYGSPYWDYGLDIDLKKGDPVPSPASGVVTYVGPRGDFGNQVRVKDQYGNEHWLSHLDATGVQVGQQIQKGQVVGAGGNTGKVIPMGGGDGSHLDYTVVNAQGQYIPPKQIEQFVRQNKFI